MLGALCAIAATACVRDARGARRRARERALAGDPAERGGRRCRARRSPWKEARGLGEVRVPARCRSAVRVDRARRGGAASRPGTPSPRSTRRCRTATTTGGCAASTPSENAGRWSPTRTLRSTGTSRRSCIEPVEGEAIAYPKTPLVLRWQPVPRAYKYLRLDRHRSRRSRRWTSRSRPRRPCSRRRQALGPGRYYWAVTPLDARKHRGTRSGVGSFDWTWPSGTETALIDLNADARVFDPQFTWDAVPGAVALRGRDQPLRRTSLSARRSAATRS